MAGPRYIRLYIDELVNNLATKLNTDVPDDYRIVNWTTGLTSQQHTIMLEKITGNMPRL